VLFFLWVAFGVLSVVAFFAILFTGRYPRSIFDFTVGVLRWSWRVAYYTYGALGTDRYPPFTLDDVPDYPARLEVAYPDHLSRGLVLVKWWLLALPHYLVVAIFIGGGPYLSWQLGSSAYAVEGAGLIGLLVFVAAVVLLFTGRYPGGIFDLVLGLNRWVLRVAAYAGLMTDSYPPFRLDTGGHDPGVLAVSSAPRPSEPALGRPVEPTARQTGEPAPRRPWTAGRTLVAVLGGVLILGGAGMVPAGGVALWFDQTARDDNGFISTDVQRYSTTTYAISSEPADMQLDGPDWLMSRVLGDVRIEGLADDGESLFIGIGPTTEVAAYLAPIEHSTVSGMAVEPFDPTYRHHAGTAPAASPTTQTFWSTSVSGTGTQTLNWSLRNGNWTVVVMNVDGSRPVVADLSLGATLPWLDDLAGWLIGGGLLLLTAGSLLIFVAARDRRYSENRS